MLKISCKVIKLGYIFIHPWGGVRSALISYGSALVHTSLMNNSTDNTTEYNAVSSHSLETDGWAESANCSLVNN